jgi:hypothetical protein
VRDQEQEFESLLEMWEGYQNHFSTPDKQHAFYWGVFNGIVASLHSPESRIKELLMELEGTINHKCLCASCREKIANGTMPSLVQRVFGREV